MQLLHQRRVSIVNKQMRSNFSALRNVFTRHFESKGNASNGGAELPMCCVATASSGQNVAITEKRERPPRRLQRQLPIIFWWCWQIHYSISVNCSNRQQKVVESSWGAGPGKKLQLGTCHPFCLIMSLTESRQSKLLCSGQLPLGVWPGNSH